MPDPSQPKSEAELLRELRDLSDEELAKIPLPETAFRSSDPNDPTRVVEVALEPPPQQQGRQGDSTEREFVGGLEGGGADIGENIRDLLDEVRAISSNVANIASILSQD